MSNLWVFLSSFDMSIISFHTCIRMLSNFVFFQDFLPFFSTSVVFDVTWLHSLDALVPWWTGWHFALVLCGKSVAVVTKEILSHHKLLLHTCAVNSNNNILIIIIILSKSWVNLHPNFFKVFSITMLWKYSYENIRQLCFNWCVVFEEDAKIGSNALHRS